MTPLVIDTNVVLDAFVFEDARTVQLVSALEDGSVQWLATQPMRDELERVLAYPNIARRLALRAIAAPEVLARFDWHASMHEAAPKASVTCGDADDQKFIDLAVHHRALLVSKDREVLKMRKRMERLGCPPVAAAYASAKDLSLAIGQ